MKVCRQTRYLIELHFEGGLSWKQEQDLHNHLAECAECASLESEQRQALEALGSYREAPLARLDVDRFVDRVQERIASEPVGVLAEVEVARTAHVKRIAVAAVILVGLGFSWSMRAWFTSSGKSETDDSRGRPTEFAVAPEQSEGPDDGDFQVHRHRAAVLELRAALVSLQGSEPDWAHYGEQSSKLRASGWPMSSLLSGLLSADDAEVARAAILALAAEGDRLGKRRLWSLRKDDRLGELAVLELVSKSSLDMEQTVQLYWEGEFSESAVASMEAWRPDQALEGARLLLRKTPRGGVPAEAVPVFVAILKKAGDKGASLALDWLAKRDIPTEVWAAEIANSLNLEDALDPYLSKDGGWAWEVGVMALASHHQDARWVSFLEERCKRSSTANNAVRVLGGQRNLSALELLLSQESNRMVDEEVWLDAWSRAIDLGEIRLVELVQGMSRSSTRKELEHLAVVLLLGNTAQTGEACVELSMARDLPERMRCSLVIRSGEIGAESCAYGLISLFGRLQRADSDLAACVLIALSQIQGELLIAGLLETQTAASPDLAKELVALCRKDSRRSQRERRYLIARKLKKVLGRRSLSNLE